MTEYDILIVGAGAAGLAAAAGAMRAGARSVLISDSGRQPGGILPQCLHSGFGRVSYGEEMTGPCFLKRLLEEFEELPPGAVIRLETTVLRINPDRTALLSSSDGLSTVCFRQLILATGCTERSIWATDTVGSRPSGVFTAGLAQQLFNLRGVRMGERIVVVGSGDVGLVMAGRFAECGTKPIAIIEKRPQLGGLLRNRKRFAEAYDIPVMLSSVVEEIHGGEVLEGITVRHLDDGSAEYIACDMLITALGLVPDRTLLDMLRQDAVLSGEITSGMISGTDEYCGGHPAGIYPDWVHLAGNCDFVHDMVDTVMRNAQRVGAKAARQIL